MNDFADASIFDLNFVAEANGLGWCFRLDHTLREIPFEDSDATLRRKRQHDVERNVIGIAIQHPVGKNPEVLSFISTRRLAVAALHVLFVLWTANWTRLA